MRFQRLLSTGLIYSVGFLSIQSLGIPAFAQNPLPTPDQLDQLLAPVALYPDPLLAQICAASTDPQQVLDANGWLQQNLNLTGQARSDAAQRAGFDPAILALINFPEVLSMMAQNINNFAAIGQAFSANQQMVTESVQRLRQQAYASGALQTNQYQSVAVQSQAGQQVVVIQPANPQVVFVPQYDPYAVFGAPGAGAVIASALSFGAGIALGSWMTGSSRPWGWGGWGWNWGGRNMVYQNNYFVVNNRYRPPRPNYTFRPPSYNRPVYARPPGNWQQRPNFRPNYPGNRPGGNVGDMNRPNPGNRPGITNPPSGQQPGGNFGNANRPNQGNRPSITNPPNGQRPGGNFGNADRQNPGNRPSIANPPNGQQPGGNFGNANRQNPWSRPSGNAAPSRPGPSRQNVSPPAQPAQPAPQGRPNANPGGRGPSQGSADRSAPQRGTSNDNRKRGGPGKQ